MMKPIYTLLSIGLCCGTLLFSSCNNCTTSVAQFENGDGSWTVYGRQDTLRMVDENNAAYTFLNTRTSSDPVPGEGFDLADACIEQYDTRRISVMQEVSNPRRHASLAVIAQRRPNDIQVTLAIGNRGSFLIPDVNTPQHATRSVNNMEYRNVFEIVNTDSTASSVRNILFNREYGFLSIEYFEGRTLVRIP